MDRASSHSLARCSKLGINGLDKEDLFLAFGEEDDQQQARNVFEPRMPFAAFGSFRQRHGDARERIRAIEAPAKLESAAGAPSVSLSNAFSLPHNEVHGHLEKIMVPVDCDWSLKSQTFKLSHPDRKPHRKGKSFSTDLDREEVWERKKERYLLEEEDEDSDCGHEYDADDLLHDELCEKEPTDESSCGSDNDGRLLLDVKDSENGIAEPSESMLDGGHLGITQTDEGHVDAMHDDSNEKVNDRSTFSKKKPFTSRPVKPFIRTRAKSLTDEDLEELRGSIDLGFGFRYSEQCNLKSTLPALELYYAINKNYVDSQSRSSPVSPLDGNALIRTNSADSTSSASCEAWRISSPGDHPSQVKTRLRHWAQAVACSVKQRY